MNLTVQLQGDLLKKIQSIGGEAKQIIVSAVKDASTQLMEDTMNNAPRSSGALMQSMRREITNQGLTATIFPTVQYAYELHGEDKRRGEMSAPMLIPSRDAKEGGPLYRWAKKKGLNPWAVRASIAKKGHKYQPWIKETADKDSEMVKETFANALNTIAERLGD